MAIRDRILRTSSVAFVLGFALILASPADNGASASMQQAQASKPVEQSYKNIQVLQGLPDSQLLTVMHFMRASLGVRCDYCHVAENGKYWMDDKPAKQIARQHIRMTAELNKASFGAKPAVTCNTCHQGRIKPLSIPSVEQGVFADTTREDADSRPSETLPDADQIIEKYYQAIGGKAAFDKIKTRVMKLSLLRPKLVNSGTPKAAMINRGETWSAEIYQKAPDKYLAIVTSPRGIIYQGFNGTAGWVKTPTGQREMRGQELAYIKQQADIYKELKLKDQYSLFKVAGKEKVGNREAYVIEALNKDGRNERLFFDTQTGFLLRKIALTETPLGMDPEQTDYEDYRDVEGVKLPFTLRVSYLDDNHLGTTRSITDIKHNILLDDNRFDAPAANK